MLAWSTCCLVSLLLTSASLSLCPHSPHPAPQRGEAHGAAAWCRRCARDPPQTALGESDRWCLTWRPGRALEPGAAILRCPLPAVDPVLKNVSGPPLLLQESHTHSRRADAHYHTHRTHLSHPRSHLPQHGWKALSGRTRGVVEEDDDDVVRDCGPKGEGEGQVEVGVLGDSCRNSCGVVTDVGARRTLIPCMFSATISPAAASSRLLWVLDLRVHRHQ